MKHVLKLLLGASLALSHQSVKANLYRIDFTYGQDLSSTDSGGLDGFMVINTADSGYSSGSNADVAGYSPVPSWIQEIQLNYDPTPLSPESGDEVAGFTSDFSSVFWDLKEDRVGNFDISLDFTEQFDQFGFGTDFPQTFVAGGMKQQYVAGGSQSEFLLESTETTPGELPLLGLATLLIYFKKLKKITYKL